LPLGNQDSDGLLPFAEVLENSPGDPVGPGVQLRVDGLVAARPNGNPARVAVGLLLETIRDRLLDRLGFELDELTGRTIACSTPPRWLANALSGATS
jgi:hypothetical protein